MRMINIQLICVTGFKLLYQTNKTCLKDYQDKFAVNYLNNKNEKIQFF